MMVQILIFKSNKFFEILLMLIRFIQFVWVLFFWVTLYHKKIEEILRFNLYYCFLSIFG